MIRSSLIASTLLAVCLSVALPLHSPPLAQSASNVELPSGEFKKKKRRLKGTWKIVEKNGQAFIAFGEDFRAARGPDLKIFLSPTAFADVNGKNAINGSLNLGLLQSTKGAQEYKIPEEANLSDFKSVLVHCEAYEVLWGGADL